MNYDIKKLNENFRNIHSRYYIDSNGVVYTSISQNTKKIFVEGRKVNINKFRRENITELNNTNKLIIKIPETNNKYYMLNDGTILQRIKTVKKTHGAIYVCLILVDGRDRGTYKSLSRLVAGSFLGSVEGKEVHHKDRDRTNNKVSNLEILTFEEHRSKDSYKEKHPNLTSND
ncbi:HNH endonuclease [Staphylococcus phage 80A]|jgi:hypothetical protein|uniref:HNH endonuclease n=2 Tax=unclassified Sepunavirus TaxID=2315193 RepID=A0AAX3Y3V7_9CAUD|nr:HNH endonuclease [Staphylococcus phage 80A]WJJ57974.1 HNH endonuclease [Staphylococcus phage 80B]